MIYVFVSKLFCCTVSQELWFSAILYPDPAFRMRKKCISDDWFTCEFAFGEISAKSMDEKNVFLDEKCEMSCQNDGQISGFRVYTYICW